MTRDSFTGLTRRGFMRRMTSITLGGTIIGLLAACGGDDESEPTATAAGQAQATSAATSTVPATSASPASTGASPTTSGSPAASTPVGQQGGELRWPVNSDPVANPVILPSPLNSALLVKLMYNNLVKYDDKFDVVPDLATSWEVSPDVKTWTFQLRTDVKWHDGEPFTADDVKYSLEIHKTPGVNSYYGAYFKILDRVEVVDPSTVAVHFTEPYGSLLEVLAFNVAMLPNHVLADQDINSPNAYLQDPIGTGPFTYDSSQSGDFYKVVANPDYFDGRPLLDAVTLRVIPDTNTQIAQVKAGALDFTTVTPQQGESSFKGEDEIEVREVPLIMHMLMSMLHSDPRFQDVRVRRAFAMAIDRQSIVDQLLLGKGQVATGPIVPVIEWAYPTDIQPLPFDPNQAKQLLTEAGWRPGTGGILEKDGQPFRFQMTYWASANTTDLAPVIQQYLKQVGVDVQLDLLEFATAVAKVREKRYEAALYWWVTPADPDLTNYYGTGGTSNIAGYSSPRADELLRRARSIQDRGQRAAIYREFQQLMVEEQPVVFLHYPMEIQAVARRLGGMPPVHFRDLLKFAPEFFVRE